MSETQEKLQAKFPAHEVKCRLGATTGDKTKGMPLFYIDARAVQGRLDEVFGWDGWTVAYREIGTKGVLCRLCVKVEAVEGWVAKEDGADITDIEPTKGGISDALRRVAASGFGIGRYLYEVKADWVPIVQHGNSYRFASRPQLPASALPGGAVPQAQPQPKTVMGHDNDSPVWTPDQSPQDAAQPEQPTNVFDEALKVAQSTPQPAPAATPPAPVQHDGGVPPCPECGGEMWDNREKTGAVVFKCKAGKWDRETQTASGCPGIIWRNNWLKDQAAASRPVSETLDFPDDSIPF